MKLMFHDDDCGALLDGEGRCHICLFHPDMQSIGFRRVAQKHIDPLLKTGRSFLGPNRERVTRRGA